MANKSSKGGPGKNEFYKKWWFWVIAVCIVGGICAAVTNNKGQDTNNQGNTISEEKKEEKKESGEDKELFEETEMEAFCQEDHVNDIHGFFGNDKINIIKMTGYNKFFDENIGNTKDTNTVIAQLTWTGYDKTTGKDINFSCYATKVDGQKKLIYIGANGSVIRGSLDTIYGN